MMLLCSAASSTLLRRENADEQHSAENPVRCNSMCSGEPSFRTQDGAKLGSVDGAGWPAQVGAPLYSAISCFKVNCHSVLHSVIWC